MMERKMFAVKGERNEMEYLCEACTDDDDEILGMVFDMCCDACGYEDLVS